MSVHGSPGSVLHCTSCGIEGDRGGGKNELLRACDRCGFLFCTHCGTGERFSSQFMCNNCWKEKARSLLAADRFQEALSIFERIGDYASIQEAVYRRERERNARSKRFIPFKRVVVRENGRYVMATEIQGKVLSDSLVGTGSKSGITAVAGWEMAPVIVRVLRHFKGRAPETGSFLFDVGGDRVMRKKCGSCEIRPTEIMFKRVYIHSGEDRSWATLINGTMILDSVFRAMSKEDIVKEFGWELAPLLSAVCGKLRKEGFFVFDLDRRKVFPLLPAVK